MTIKIFNKFDIRSWDRLTTMIAITIAIGNTMLSIVNIFPMFLFRGKHNGRHTA